MLLQGVVALLIQGPAVEPAVSPVAAPPKVDWIRRPEYADIVRCAKRIGRNVREAVVVMQCRTGPDDSIRDCVATSNTRAPDTRYETAAICASKAFSIRATGIDGRPVLGAVVTVPFRFASFATYDARVRNFRKPPQSDASGGGRP